MSVASSTTVATIAATNAANHIHLASKKQLTLPNANAVASFLPHLQIFAFNFYEMATVVAQEETQTAAQTKPNGAAGAAVAQTKPGGLAGAAAASVAGVLPQPCFRACPLPAGFTSKIPHAFSLSYPHLVRQVSHTAIEIICLDRPNAMRTIGSGMSSFYPMVGRGLHVRDGTLALSLANEKGYPIAIYDLVQARELLTVVPNGVFTCHLFDRHSLVVLEGIPMQERQIADVTVRVWDPKTGASTAPVIKNAQTATLFGKQIQLQTADGKTEVNCDIDTATAVRRAPVIKNDLNCTFLIASEGDIHLYLNRNDQAAPERLEVVLRSGLFFEKWVTSFQLPKEYAKVDNRDFTATCCFGFHRNHFLLSGQAGLLSYDLLQVAPHPTMVMEWQTAFGAPSAVVDERRIGFSIDGDRLFLQSSDFEEGSDGSGTFLGNAESRLFQFS